MKPQRERSPFIHTPPNDNTPKSNQSLGAHQNPINPWEHINMPTQISLNLTSILKTQPLRQHQRNPSTAHHTKLQSIPGSTSKSNQSLGAHLNPINPWEHINMPTQIA